MGKILSLILVLLLAILSWWFQDDWKKPLLKPSQQNQHFPDYFLENFSTTKMNADGNISHILRARHMQHYNDDGSIEMQQVNIVIKQKNNEWMISAQRAESHDDNPTIYFYDQVLLQRQNKQQEIDLSIRSDYLEFNTQSRIAKTDKATKITTHDSELNSIGMMIDVSQGILKLNSQVKGRYARDYFSTH